MEPPRPADAPAIYDRVAVRFERHAVGAFWNAWYDRPAVLGVLGPVTGLRVLDAGCGPGLYAEELVAAGADVVALDASAEMVRLARGRLGPGTPVLRHDLNEPLSMLADASFDRVVSALVWHYVDARVAALRELHRVLRPGGAVVISCEHPTAHWLHHGGSYFAVEANVEHWRSLDVTMPSWRLPLSALCDEFAEGGFVIERIVEPQPVERAREVDPEEYRKLTNEPGFIVFRLRRDDR